MILPPFSSKGASPVAALLSLGGREDDDDDDDDDGGVGVGVVVKVGVIF